jgi:hypothetical protein
VSAFFNHTRHLLQRAVDLRQFRAMTSLLARRSRLSRFVAFGRRQPFSQSDRASRIASVTLTYLSAISL